MNLEQFKEYVKTNRGRFKPGAGRQEYLYQAVKKYGHTGQEIEQAILQSCPLALKQKMLEIIKIIPFQKEGFNIKGFINWLVEIFIKQHFVKFQDLIRFIETIKNGIKVEYDKIITIYGMRQEYPQELEKLMKSVLMLADETKSDPKGDLKWKQIEQNLRVAGEGDHRSILSTFLQGQKIQDVQKLKNLSKKYNIFIKKNHQQKIFDVVNNLGIQHKLSQQILKLSTYEAFHQNLIDICKTINLRKSKIDFKIKSDQIIKKLKDELMLDEVNILNLVHAFYHDQKQQLEKIVEDYSLEEQIQNIKNDLNSFTQHLKEQYRIEQAKNIIKYFESILLSKGKEIIKKEIEYDFKAKVDEVRKILYNDFCFEEQQSVQFICYYYSNKMVEFNQIVNNFSLNQQEGLIQKLTNMMIGILESVSMEERENLKTKIYVYLNFNQQQQVKQQTQEIQLLIPENQQKQQVKERQEQDIKIQQNPNNLSISGNEQVVVDMSKVSSISQININEKDQIKQIIQQQIRNTFNEKSIIIQQRWREQKPNQNIEQRQRMLNQKIKMQDQQFFDVNNDQYQQKKQQKKQQKQKIEVKQSLFGKFSKKMKEGIAVVSKHMPSNDESKNNRLPQRSLSSSKKQISKQKDLKLNNISAINIDDNKDQFDIQVENQKQKMINPFKPQKPLKKWDPKIVKVLLILLGKDSIKKIIITSQRKQDIKSIFESYQILNIDYSLVVFRIAEKVKYNIRIQYSGINSQPVILPLTINGSQNGLEVVISYEKHLKTKSIINLHSAINNSLFQSIDFIIRKRIQSLSYMDQQMLPWLKLLYDQYQMNPQIDKYLIEKIIKTIRIFQKQQFINLNNSQFYIYFLFAVYKQKALTYYQQFELGQYLKFPETIQRRVLNNYPNTRQLFNYYIRLHFYDTVNNPQEYLYPVEMTKKLLFSNITHQLQQNIIQILVNAVNKSPKKISKHDDQINRLFKDKLSLCLHDYYNLKILYFKHALQTSRISQEKLIINFMQTMINLSMRDHKNCRKSSKIQYHDIQNIFSEYKGVMQSRLIRVGQGVLPLIYGYCKILAKLSYNQFNFMQAINNIIKYKSIELVNNYSIAIFLAAITNPILPLDIQIIDNIIHKGSIQSYQLKQMIKALLDDQLGKYDRSKFEQIVTSMIMQYRDKYVFEVQVILQFVDEYHQKYKQNKEISQFLKRLFVIFNPLIAIIQQNNNKLRYINGFKFKRFLQLYFKIKDSTFQTFVINKIFNQAKTKLHNRQSYIVQEIDKALPDHFLQNKDRKTQLISIFIQNNQNSIQYYQKQIFEFLKSNPSYLDVLSKTNNVNFENALSKVIKMINSDDLYKLDLQSMTKSIKQLKNIRKQLKVSIQQAKQRQQLFQSNIKKMIVILQKKKHIFNKDIQNLNNINQVRLLKYRLVQVYNIDDIYQQFLKYSKEIYILQQYTFWNQEGINQLEDYIQQYHRIKVLMTKAIQQFINGIITYGSFKTYFISNNFKDIAEYCFKNAELKQKITIYNAKLNKKQINSILQYSQSLTYMYSIIKSSDLNISFTKFQQFVTKIQNDEDFLLEEFANQMKEVEIKLIKAYNINKKWQEIHSLSEYLQKQQSAKIVKSTFKNQKMFNMINKKNLDSKSVTDLKEYINDLQNSILNMQTIKQFESVLIYWQLVKKAPNFNKFIIDLNELLGKRKIQLSKNIQNCSASYTIIDQKMDQAVNRQTSFKYQIQAIFKLSLFQITSSLQIYIEIDGQILQRSSIKQLQNEKQNIKKLKIDFKRLNNYKDKSILLINDIGKQQNIIDESMKELMKLFQKYNQMFNIIQQIKLLSQKLSNYGYNPNQIKCQIEIKDGNINRLIQQRQELLATSEEWIYGIKSIYSQSYLMTHFIGSQLNKFVDDCLKQKYNPSLQRIINMSQKQFHLQYKSRQFLDKIQEANRGNSLQRIKSIIQAFQKFQSNFIDSSRAIEIVFDEPFTERSSTFQKYVDKQSKPIILLTCSEKQIYSCLLQKSSKEQKKIAKLTQVMYCQQSTTAEEIQFFLDRALICNNKTHFIIGAHNLKQQTKLYFSDQLSILSRERNDDLKMSQLCFVDSAINDRLYAFISRPKQFQVEKKELFLNDAVQNTKKLVQLMNKTLIIASKKPGLGKTYLAEQQSKKMNKQIRYFPICGNIKFQNLAKRLKKLNLQQNNSLLIQIGHIENKKKLQIFLSQIIIFRCFYFEEYIFIPQNLTIFIEIQNIIQLQTEDLYHILNILKDHGKIHHIEKFDIGLIQPSLEDQDDKFVYRYLAMLNKPNQIATKDYSYDDFVKEKDRVPFPENLHQLLQKYFVSWFNKQNIQPTYAIFKSFKKILFNFFRSFGSSPYFYRINFEEIHPAFKRLELQKSRQNFLLICISNALQFLKETVTTNDFDQDKNSLQSVSQMINKFPMLIASSSNFTNYEFIYLNDETVNIPIKSLLLSQNQKYFQKIQSMKNMNQLHQIFAETSLSKAQGNQLELRMFKILRQLSGNKKFQGEIKDVYKNVPELNNYKLTLDNFFKMCLIIHRSASYVPCIIMGQSGVGKTALIDFLVRTVYQEQLEVYNVHAGIHEEDLQQWVKKFKRIAQNQLQAAKTRNDIIKQQMKKKKQHEIFEFVKPKRVWVFFDQFNTTDELNYIKQMIIERRFMGEALPENVIFMAACNPYRKKKESINRVKAGIKKANQTKGAELAFKVKPPPLAMIQLMWDYQQLGEKENQSYVEKMLSQIQYKKRDLLIKSIVYTHELFKKTVEVSSVSLRDVARFKQLYNWFLDHSPKDENNKKKVKKDPLKNEIKFENNHINQSERAAVLAFNFCYALRYSTNAERKVFLQNVQIKMGFQKSYMQQILYNQQRYYIDQLKIKNQKIAYNSALMENVFTSLVCLMNKIPILIVGNPGSSKSLSIKMLNSNLRGQNSSAQFCRGMPEINMIYYQGSEASTSKGVEQVFDKAKSKTSSKQDKKWNILNCILFDQIGLAEKSVHNPLKVLHAKLETNIKEVGFIGISNWELDAAKMSRFLVISRSNPDEQEIKDTALKIYESYLEDDDTHSQRFKMLGSYYFKFINKWNSNINNRQGFFGLRDFYSYIKYVCSQIIKNGNDPQVLDKAIAKAIQINFDGQKESLKIFRQIASTSEKYQGEMMDPIDLVNKNLQQTQSRCLMLIIRGDSLIPIINDKLLIKGRARKAVCIYGSTFLEDQQSEQYNLEVTSLIINHISRGSILAFKDINNSIQTSLYDLFNKSFSQIGNKRYCRVAVGANSNPKCNVHEDFNAIVYIDEEKLRDLDLAFLNRFQKHYLNLKSVVTLDQIQILKEILGWLNNLLSFEQEEKILKDQNFLMNSSEESIVTLIIKYRGNSDRIAKIKIDLLKNKTTDFIIAIKDNEQKINEIQKFEKQIIPINQCKEDMIVFTYDQFSNLTEEETIFDKNNKIIRLSEIKNEKGLRKELEIGLSSKQYSNVEIKVYYQNHYMHINFLLFLAKQIKNNLQSKKQIIVIIQLHRFSLHQLNIQHINISYLHKFQQYFAEDIHSLEEIPALLESKKCLEAYKKLNLSENFADYYMNALKLVKFKCEFQEIASLKEQYFSQCLQIIGNQYFKDNTEKIIAEHLKNKKIDYNFIQKNAEDVMSCSNIKEAISKFISEIVKEVIFYSIRMVIEEGFLFYFVERGVLKIQNKNHIQFLKQSYLSAQKRLIQIFHIHFEEQRDKLIKKLPILRQQIKYQKAIQSNTVRIKKQRNIIPSSFKDFSLIFVDKQNKGNKNLQQLAMRIPAYKKQENQNQYDIEFINAKNFIQNDFKIASYKTLNKITQNKELQVLYLYDILTFYLNENNLSLKSIGHYIELMMTVFQQFKIADKLIILTNDRRLAIAIFQLIDLYLQHQKPRNILNLPQIMKKDNGNPFLELLAALFNMGMNIIEFNENNIRNFDNVTSYISYFRSVFIKLRQIYISYREAGLQFTKQFLTKNKLLQMFEKIDISNDQLIDKYVKSIRDDHTIYFCIYKYCSELLKDERTKNSTQIIINFLSLDVFCNWFQNTDEQQEFEEQKQICIRDFVDMCNKYSLFANNSAYFISMILPEFEQTQKISDASEYFKELQPKHYIKEDYIDMESNFTVALSNHISAQIEEIFAEQFKKQVETDEQVFITKHYEEQLLRMLNNVQDQSKIYELFKIQFVKRYGFYYLQLLTKNIENELQNRIDALLCKETELMRHIRIYLLKHLYANYNSFQEIKRDFIDQNRCKWILSLKDLIAEKQSEFFLPPKILKDQDHFYKLMESFIASKYCNFKNFHDLILEGLKNPNNKYELLTFFMLHFYTKSVSIKILDQLKAWLNNRGDINENNNKVIRQLLNCYLNNSINKNFCYTSNQKFMEQLPLLNYLNIFVASSGQKNPLNDMFFNQGGNIDNDYAGFLSSKFLIGSLKNPALGRLQFILKRQAQNFTASAYINCSRNCDYLSPVGGTFYGTYDGCANPYHQSKCAFCGNVIGAHAYDVLTNPQAKKFLPNNVHQMMNTIKGRGTITLRKIDNNFVYPLLGYTLGNTKQKLIEFIDLKKHYAGVATDFLQGESEMIHHKLLQALITFVWSFLIEANLINQNSLRTLFNYDIETSKIFLNEATHFYFQQMNKSVKFVNNSDITIWHLGIGKYLLNILTNYNTKNPLKQGINNLSNSAVRDNFEKHIEDFLFPFCEKEKEKLILESRNVKTVNKTDIIRQIGDLKQHLLEYPQLKLYKLLKIQLSPCFENMKIHYRQTLSKQYPILAYLMNNQTVQQKLKLFKNIYSFISKLWKLFNLQITRQESQKPLSDILVGLFKQNEKQKKQIQVQIDHFVKSWNRLAQLKYQLKHQCHEFGQLEKIDKNFALKTFLLDKIHMDNVDGRKLIGLIVVSANQYNSICGIIERNVKAAYSQESAQIFSSNKLNPTLLSSDAKLLLFPTEAIREKIQRYSSFSVEYGISNPSYPFDQIQSMIAKQFYGCKYLIVEEEKFCYINYIGEQVHFITDLRDDQNQKTLQQTNQMQRIKQYLKKLEKEETFYKIIKGIQGSLQNIVIFFKNYKLIADNHTKTIRNFVNQKRIKGIVKQLFEEPIQSLPLSNLADFYETIQFYTFEKVKDMLDNVYKKELSKQQKQDFVALLRAMKRDVREEGIPAYRDFKTALYRLAGRNLLLMICDEKKFIAEQLCYVQFYWPKDIEIQYYQRETVFTQIMGRLTISKVGEMLNYLPFKEKDDEQAGKKKGDIRNDKKLQKLLDNNNKPKKTQKTRNVLD